MILKCPHQQVIEIQNLGGITCYMHQEQQTFCTLMNDFDTRASDISRTYIETIKFQYEVTPLMRVVFLSSREARQQWYIRLSESHGDMLRAMLRGTSQLVNTLPALRETIIDELWGTFGDTFLTNIYLVSKQRIILPSRNAVLLKTSGMEKLPMDNLIDSQILKTSLMVDAQKQDRGARVREALDNLAK